MTITITNDEWARDGRVNEVAQGVGPLTVLRLAGVVAAVVFE